MRRIFRVLIVVLQSGSLLLAASTKYVSTYRNPAAVPGEFSGKKVAAFVVIPNEELRSAREETVAEELRQRGINCVAGYTVLPGELVKDRDKSREFLKKAAVSGAVILRLVEDQEATKYSRQTSGWFTQPHYGNFWNYWNHSWASVYVRETSWTERVVTLETLVYSIEKDELLWAGKSNTTSPDDIKKFIKDLMDAAGKELRKIGLVPK